MQQPAAKSLCIACITRSIVAVDEASFMLWGSVLQVDCSSLPEGLHYAEISATDSTAPWRGHLFRIPVTVIKPATSGKDSSSTDTTIASGDHVFLSHQGEPESLHTEPCPPHLFI